MNLKSLFIVVIGIVFFSTPSLATGEETQKFVKQVEESIQSLDLNTPFVFYDLFLTHEEKQRFKDLQIDSPDNYDHYGNLDGLTQRVREYITGLSSKNSSDASEVSTAIYRIVMGIVQATHQETAWVALRASIPHSDFDVPRWHRDGYYYAPFEGNPYKFALSLKGPSTLFYKLPSNLRSQFDTMEEEAAQNNGFNRKALANLLNPFPENRCVGSPYQGAVFIVGSSHAAVHSEPPINEERLFLSILPGSRKQIQEWESKDKQK